MAKINYQSINPRTVAKLSEKAARELYSGMRSILRKRNERMTAAGKTPAFRTPEPVKNVENVKAELSRLAAELRSPLSSITGVAKRQKRSAETLQRHGYDIPKGKLDDFGRFMEATRKRQGETYKGKSGVAAQAYTELIKTGVSGKTIERSFKKWLENTERLNELVTAAQQAADTHPGKRVTGVELRNIMKDFGA